MPQRIIYTNEDGEVSIVAPSPNWPVPIEILAAKVVPDGVPFDVIDTSSVPVDRSFRCAWIKSGADIVTDIPKARYIAHKRRRVMRDTELRPLDIKATIPREAVKAEADRQAIRDRFDDMQVSIDGARTEADLLSILSGGINNG